MDTTATPGPDVDDRSVRSWAQHAEALGEPGLAADLLTTVDGADVGHLARLALLDGRPADALTLLARGGDDVVPAHGPTSPEHVVAAAARAAQGDEGALVTLLHVGSRVADPQQRADFLRLLAAAAGPAGRHDLADDAWVTLVSEHGDRTPQGLGGWAAAHVARRDAARSTDAVRAVVGVARGLQEALPAAADDAGATTLAVRDLQRRGDRAGAALLAAAVARGGRTSPDLRALRDETALHRRRAPTVVPWILALLLLPLGVVGIALGIGVVEVLRRVWRRVPGVSLCDERVWDTVDGARLDDGRQTGAHSEVRPLPALAALAGFVAGIGVAFEVDARVRALVPGLGDGWAMLLWAVPLLGVPALSFVLVESARRALVRRRVAREGAADRAAQLRSAGACRCWDPVAAVGPFAAAYASEHLVAAPRCTSLPRGTAVRRCPLTDVPWLVTTTTGGRAQLVLRGAPPLPAAAAPPPPGTAGYL
ncbi:hypothetical protein [Cellulomonas iranensis]|uniref:hypothetical protein n=1 Tax=Cellulomonas iranensis TaxID=76862 RepID=UPI003D7E8441